MSEYKTFEELKEELGDKFEDYMYKANIELLNIIKEVREYIEMLKKTQPNERAEYGYILISYEKILEILDKENK